MTDTEPIKPMRRTLWCERTDPPASRLPMT